MAERTGRPRSTPGRRRRRRGEETHIGHDERRSLREQQRVQRRTELLEAAATAIRRDGPAASMEQIAREAGVTKPILYRHFGDRDGLVDALSQRFVTELMERLSRALAGDAPPRELVAAGIDAYLGLVEEDPNLYRFLVDRSVAGADGAEVLFGVMAEAGRQVAVVLGERMRAVGADSGAAEPWAFGLVGMVHAAGDWWLDQRTMSRPALVAYLTRLAWDGMASAVPGPSADERSAPPDHPEETR